MTLGLLFTYRGGRIVRIGVAGQDPPDAVSYGGGLDNRVGVDCASRGMITITTASIEFPRTDVYRVERRRFRFVGNQFVLATTNRFTMTFIQLSGLREFEYSAFHSCRQP